MQCRKDAEIKKVFTQSRKVAKNKYFSNDIAKQIVDIAFHVHSRLGPGLLESMK